MSVDPVSAAVTAGGAIASGLAGGGGQTRAAVPPDLIGPRRRQIQLLEFLLGLGGQFPGSPGGGQNRFRGSLPGGAVGGAGEDILRRGGFGNPGGIGAGDFGGDPTKRLESFFGQLGSPLTDLQRQSVSGISQFLNQPAPEQRALDISLPALQGILNSKPGAGIIGALEPTFQRNLASANQEGARFGSWNALLRSRALEDFNLLAANAASQGVQQQLAAAQALGVLSESAGQNPFARLAGGFGIGQQVAQQQDIETQRRLQILLGLLNTAQSATLGLPITQEPGFFQNALGSAADIGAIINSLSRAKGG